MSYDEHLISQAGGDGEPITISANDAKAIIRALRFYAEHPEYNDDTETATDALARVKMAVKVSLNEHYGRRADPILCDHYHCALPANHPGRHQGEPTTPAARTEDFTHAELYGNQNGELWRGLMIRLCGECGGMTGNPSRHLDWHNKLLP